MEKCYFRLKPATLLKVTFLQRAFFTFFELQKWHQIAQSVTILIQGFIICFTFKLTRKITSTNGRGSF